MVLALFLAEQVYKQRMLPMTVTSANDSTHKDGSLHYKGLAIDLRTKGTGSARSLYNDLSKKLTSLGYDVILEFENGDNEHIHVEFDPH